MPSATHYFDDLNTSIGATWNRFWFTPTSATTLGVLRIATGLLALYAVATYATDLQRWFAADGMLPMSLIGDLYRPEGQILGQWSVLDYLPDSMLWPAYWTSLAVTGFYTLGIGGRAIAIAATIATLSFFTRAPLLIGEFEHVLAMLMIYLCVGRACDAFSILSLFQKKDAAPTHSAFSIPPSAFNTISLRLIQVHLAIIHLMMGYAQLAVPESAWWSGEGVWLAAARPGMPLVDLSGLVDHPRIVAAWSHAITLYLLAFPVLVWKRLARPLILTWGATVWISFAIASGWVPFCLVMLTGLAAFIEPRSSK
ncbi:MAG: hypothetical protein H0T51_11420 [Pirellulales bacterium]|nr:hypothetical protein [Pirellulales bacterium]